MTFSKIKAKSILFSTILIIFAFSGITEAEESEIDSCTTISSPGTYVLERNIEESVSSKCIEINSSDVIFDGDGHKIDAKQPVNNYGVYVHNVTPLTNVTIINVELTEWGNGIYFNNTHNGQIHDNKVSLNVHGINLVSSSNNRVTENIAQFNKVSGIRLEGSSQNILMNNNASSNMAGFTFVYSSNNNIINNNKIELNELFGIALGQSNNNDLSSNFVYLNQYGIFISSSTQNRIYDNFFNNTNNTRFNEPANGNFWNTTLKSGTNIVGGSNIGGNYWADLNATGYSQLCIDGDIDGICDMPYYIDPDKVDYLPLYPVPEVSTLIMVFTGMAVLIGFTRYRKKS